MSHKQHQAVFLDRDGVINKEVDYLYKPSEFEFIDGVLDACKQYQNAGYLLIVITNQSGIARGYFSEDDFHHLNHWMLEQFKQYGVNISAVYYCPHHPNQGSLSYRKECNCRKPKPGMIIQAQTEWNIDLARSLLFGDKRSDIEAGKAAGVGTNILLESGHKVSDVDKTCADMVLSQLQYLVIK